MDEPIWYITPYFGILCMVRGRIIYIFGMEPLVDSDRKGSYLIRQVFLHLCVTRYFLIVFVTYSNGLH